MASTLSKSADRAAQQHQVDARVHAELGQEGQPGGGRFRSERPHPGQDVDGVDQVQPGAQGRPADHGAEARRQQVDDHVRPGRHQPQDALRASGVDAFTADLVPVAPFLHVASQRRQVAVGGDDPRHLRAPPQVVQRRLALHAHAQEKNLHRALPGDPCAYGSCSFSNSRRSFLVGRPLPLSLAAKISPSGSRRARASFSRSAAGGDLLDQLAGQGGRHPLDGQVLDQVLADDRRLLDLDDLAAASGREGLTASPATWTRPPRQAWLARLLVLKRRAAHSHWSMRMDMFVADIIRQTRQKESPGRFAVAGAFHYNTASSEVV